MSLLGGYLREIPKPHVRKFGSVAIGALLPDGRIAEKRPVVVSIMKFYGIGQHLHVSIREDDNPIWNVDPNHWAQRLEKGGLWHEAWDDEMLRGLAFDESFVKRRDALAWVKSIAKKHFSTKTHRLVWNPHRSTVRRPQWIYREGD